MERMLVGAVVAAMHGNGGRQVNCKTRYQIWLNRWEKKTTSIPALSPPFAETETERERENACITTCLNRIFTQTHTHTHKECTIVRRIAFAKSPPSSISQMLAAICERARPYHTAAYHGDVCARRTHTPARLSRLTVECSAHTHTHARVKREIIEPDVIRGGSYSTKRDKQTRPVRNCLYTDTAIHPPHTHTHAATLCHHPVTCHSQCQAFAAARNAGAPL